MPHSSHLNKRGLWRKPQQRFIRTLQKGLRAPHLAPTTHSHFLQKEGRKEETPFPRMTLNTQQEAGPCVAEPALHCPCPPGATSLAFWAQHLLQSQHPRLGPVSLPHALPGNLHLLAAGPLNQRL